MKFRSSLLAIMLLLITPWIHPGLWTRVKSYDLPAVNESFFADQIEEQYILLKDSALNPEAFRLGMQGYLSLRSRGMVNNDSLLSIIDFSQPSDSERFFVINLIRSAVIYKSLVSHGRNSGELFACQFSNKMQSHQSALGFYLTGEPYRGGQGYSLHLSGMDTGYNDLSKIRGIVIHGAVYATKDYIHRYGRLGRSFGCPALPPVMNKRIINAIKGGSVLFSYFPDQTYFSNSVVLRHQPDERTTGYDDI